MSAVRGEFDGRVALVAGAAQGIGAAAAGLLAARGAILALMDRDGDALQAGAQALRGKGAVVHTCTIDLAELDAASDAIDEFSRRLGGIDHFAHVAGILRVGDVLDMDVSDWDACMAVNARALMGTTRAVARIMVRRGRGSIVAVGSNAAAVPRAGMAAYAASKAAAAQYLRCLALELAPHGVRCNVVSPGSTDTPMQWAFAPDEAARAAILRGAPDRYRLGIPLGRIAEPEDIAEGVCFLLSDRARHIALHDLRIDGGATLGA